MVKGICLDSILGILTDCCVVQRTVRAGQSETLL